MGGGGEGGGEGARENKKGKILVLSHQMKMGNERNFSFELT